MFCSAILDKHTTDKSKIIVQKSFPPTIFMAFKGGGVLGTAYIGCLSKLEKYNFLKDLKYVAGTSAGAITALALSLGYSSEEMYEIFYDFPIETFLEDAKSYATKKGFVAKAKSLYKIYSSENHALSSGKQFFNFLEKIVEKKFPTQRELTFAELANAIKQDEENNVSRKLRHLYVTGTNVSLYCPESRLFCEETQPNMPIAKGVRISGSYPTVFENVEWDGYSYTDGGIKKNLPTRIFDKKHFLNGFEPTENLTNPFLFLVKVASKKDHLQFSYGVNKKVPLRKFKDLSYAFYNVFSETIDPVEIRQERLVLTLPDGDCEGVINSLEFTINDKGKIKLINGAEKATQEFLENYAGAAYDIKTYDNIRAWLDDQKSLDQLDKIILAYEERQSIDNSIELKNYIQFLNTYFNYRREKLRNSDLKPNFEFPQKHYDLPFDYPKESWHYKVIQDMKENLQTVSNQLALAKAELEEKKLNLQYKMAQDIDVLHNKYFDEIAAYTISSDYVAILSARKQDLDNKLGLKQAYSYPSNPFFCKFCDLIEPILDTEGAPDYDIPDSPIKIIFRHLDLFDPIINFSSEDESTSVILQLNLRYLLDLKLYLLACIYFLGSQNCPKEYLLKKIFLLNFNELIPDNYYALSQCLDQTGLDLQSSAFKLEKLIHYFDCALQKVLTVKSAGEDKADVLIYHSNINLDTLYSNINQKDHEDQKARELKCIYTGANTPHLFFKSCKNDGIEERDFKNKSGQTYSTPAWFLG